MYSTRSQTTSFDENRRAEPKGMAAATKAAPIGQAKAALAAQANNRRALGDIGNLVGSLSTRCNVTGKDASNDNGVSGKQYVAPVERPVTRRYAQSTSQNVAKPPVPLPPAADQIEAKTEDLTTWGAKQRRTAVSLKQHHDAGTNVDELKENVSQNRALPPGHPARMKALLQKAGARTAIAKKAPTLTAQLTARSEAACGGFEAEMTDAEEPLPNIDEGDEGNHLAVVDYVEDIYSFYRKTEVQSCVSPDYMSLQTDINDKMRAILIDWLIEVHLKFKLMPETLFLTTNVIDRYLSVQNVSRKYLQLVGVTAMLIAAKYEEIWAPQVRDFVFISDNAYTSEQLLSMEKKMLNTLRFNLTVPTPYVFVARYLKAASSDRQMEMLVFFLVELCLTEYVMVKYSPSMLAAAAVFTAQCCLKRTPVWSTLLQRHSGYCEEQLRECAGHMASFHRRAGEGNLTVVHNKYSSSKFGSVAQLSPAKLPLEENAIRSPT